MPGVAGYLRLSVKKVPADSKDVDAGLRRHDVVGRSKSMQSGIIWFWAWGVFVPAPQAQSHKSFGNNILDSVKVLADAE